MGNVTRIMGSVWRKEIINQTVNVIANATYVGTGVALSPIPANCILHGIFIKSAAPAGTAGGAKTIAYAVGTAVNADADLADATDIDVMISTGAIVAAADVHGNAAMDHVAAYFPTDQHGRYVAAALQLYLNFIGQSATATANPGTVTCLFEIWTRYTEL